MLRLCTKNMLMCIDMLCSSGGSGIRGKDTAIRKTAACGSRGGAACIARGVELHRGGGRAVPKDCRHALP